MRELRVIPAHLEDVPTLAETMRESDVAELKAVSGESPAQALTSSLLHSDKDMVFTAFTPAGNPVAMFGVAPFTEGDTMWGAAWLLSSPELDNYKRSAWLHSKRIVDLFLTRYSCLANMVDDRNTTSRAWLKRLGFVEAVGCPAYGVEQLNFTFFVRLK